MEISAGEDEADRWKPLLVVDERDVCGHRQMVWSEMGLVRLKLGSAISLTSAGIEPVNMLLLKSSHSSLHAFPISGGMKPVNLL